MTGKFWVLLIVGFVFASLSALLLVPQLQAQDMPFSPDQDYFIDASIDNLTPYVGQPILYTFRFFAFAKPPTFIPQLPDFAGFWHRQNEDFTTATPISVGGRQYELRELHLVLYPTHAGNLIIEPGNMTISTAAGSQELVLSTNAISLQVQPLPNDAPAGFTEAVGQFVEIAAEVDKYSVNQGEPITLHVQITGSGNLEQISAPTIGLSTDWRLYINQPTIEYSTTGIWNDKKTFEWMLIPDQAGEQIIPAITFSYFDPEGISYRSLVSEPITITVNPVEGYQIQSTTADTTRIQPVDVMPLKILVTPPETGTTQLEDTFWLLWLFPPAALGIGWLVTRRRPTSQRRPSQQRQSTALGRAKSQLEMARKTPDQAAYQLVIEAIYGYFANKLGGSITDLAVSDLQKAMSDKAVEPAIVDRVLSCLQWAEEGKYAPVGEEDIEPLINRTLVALNRLDSVWKTK